MRRFISVFVLVGLLFGCTVPPKQPVTYTHIQDALENGLRGNSIIATTSKQSRLPIAVDTALLSNTALKMPKGKMPKDKRFTINVDDLSARTFFMGLVKDTNYSMIIHPDINDRDKITLSLKDVTIKEALDVVRDMYGYDYRSEPGGFQILPKGLLTKIFTINYLHAKRGSVSETRVSSNQVRDVGDSQEAGNTSSASSYVKTESMSDFWLGLQSTLESMIGGEDDSKVIVEPQAGIVMVHAYPGKMHEIEQYLATMQTRVDRQVILEAKILEVELSNGFDSGIDWKILGARQIGQANAAGSEGFGTFKNNIFSMKITAGSSFENVIRLLSTQGNVQVLSSPRVSAINNQKALIRVGTDEYFVTGVTTLTLPQANGTTETTQDVKLHPFFSGIALDVTPQIDRQGEVVLHIHPSITEVEDNNKTIELGNNQTLRLPLAKNTIRESDSVVRAKDGQIIVLGGLIQTKTTEDIGAVPVLGKVPYLGSLFRNTTQRAVRSELVILLKPIVVNKNTWTKDIRQTSARFDKLDRGFHVGSHPEVFGTRGEQLPSLPPRKVQAVPKGFQIDEAKVK